MKNLYTLLSRKTDPKAQRPNKMTRSRKHKNKKVIIRDDPVQYPYGYVTMDGDCDCVKVFRGREMVKVMGLEGLAERRDRPSTTYANWAQMD